MRTIPTPGPAARRLVRRGVAALAATLAAAGTAAAVAPAAQAADGYTFLAAQHSSLVLDVAGASHQPGARVIQWYRNGGANQQWQRPANLDTGPVKNRNSGMCLTTDGVAGHQLYQMPCDGSASQRFTAIESAAAFGFVVTLVHESSRLVVDVAGHSQWAGAGVNLWYANGGDNQSFYPWY